jgi:class 3 adenylate cyclase/tetratricopeptide (TPR) repeat protein
VGGSGAGRGAGAGVGRDAARLQRHLPQIAVDWFLDVPDRTWRVVDGSLCFADISGFTALTERLARRGRIGGEELVDTLSLVFGAMLDVAARRGGQLLKFGGDALLFLFQGDGHAAAAASSAAEMRRELRGAEDVPTSVGRLRLSMSVGIHSGDIHLFLVGAPVRELLVLGPSVGATIAAENAANAGQILVSDATAAMLPAAATKPHDARRRELRWRRAHDEPNEPAARRPVRDEQVRALLPDHLAGALADRPEPGHRVATVAFARLTGTDRLLTGGMDRAAQALHDLMSEVQRALHDEHVTLLATDIDTDGIKVFCSAGVPRRTEDDEGRMLRALARIAAARLPCELQIGVNRGHVFAAELGNSRRAAYSAMGDTVNTAARIATAAPPGAIYAHPTVLDHARTLREARPVGPFRFKGKSEPITLYEVGEELGPRQRSGQDALPLVGRGDELRRVADAIARRHDGAGGVITVTGPPGVGKSRLVREALAAAGHDERLEIGAEPYGVTTPYRPLRDPVRGLLGLQRGPRMATTLLQRLEEVAPALMPFAPLLGDVAHVDVPSTPETDAIADRHRPGRTADVLIELLRDRSPDGLVIVVEDGQWVDESTARVLARFDAVTGVLPWLLILTRRDGDEGFTPSSGERLVVGPLDDDAVRDLAKAATEAAPLRPHELDDVVAKAAGSPLYVEELSRALRAVHSLEAVPDSVNAAIASQVDALAPPARRGLGYASVLGRSFRPQVLQGLMQADGFAVDEATRAELDPFFARDGDARLRFRNGLIRDVVYEGMAYRTRARLHGVAAAILERISDDLDADSDMLAHHFWQGGDAERTWTYSRRAAGRAEQTYANAEAAAQLERALEAARRLPDVTVDEEFACWQRLGELRDRAGLLDGALDAYARAARLAPSDPLLRARLLLRRAHAHERSGAYPVALSTASRTRRLLDGAPGRRAAAVRADALAFTALVRQRQERVVEALRQAERAMAEGRSAGALPAQARAGNVISWAAMMLGRPDASEWARRSLVLYEAAADLDGQADLANNLGIQAYFDGRWSESLDLYQRSRDACTRVGNVIDAAATDANIGEVLVNQGRLDEAQPLLREASRVLTASGHQWGAAFAEMHFGRLLARKGDLEHALAVLTTARDGFASIGRGASVYEASLHLADVLTRAGRPAEALAVLDGSVGATTDDVRILDPARARFTAAALAASGRLDDAGGELSRGIAAARAWNLEYELSLLLAAVADFPLPVDTGSDESPAEESARLLTRLGVVDPPPTVPASPGHRHIGSPSP